MELLYSLNDTHTRSISTIGYNPSRREILVGFEDMDMATMAKNQDHTFQWLNKTIGKIQNGLLKIFEGETGVLVASERKHQGWITSFIYWPRIKANLSGSHDTNILFWSGQTVTDQICIDEPVYTLCLHPRRYQLLVGTATGVQMYNLDEDRISGHYIDMESRVYLKEHRDIVKCITVVENRIYSAGFDQRLIAYDSAFTGDHAIQASIVVNHAHDAGITHLVAAKDADNSNWIITGSFDKCVKVWTGELKIVHVISNFMTAISGLCFIPRNRTLWITAGAPYAWIYDPKSGENISDFCDTFVGHENEKYYLLSLHYYPELSLVMGSSSRRHLNVWKYQPSCCVSMLKTNSPVESLTYTAKVPILIFSGDSLGKLVKWERRQANFFSYTNESMKTTESMMLLLKQKQQQRQRELELKSIATGKPIDKTLAAKREKGASRKAFLRLKYVEDLDFLIASCEDGNLYVFGFDERAVEILAQMKQDDENEKRQLRDNEASDSDNDSIITDDSPRNSEESLGDYLTKRVAGFTCRMILMDHNDMVTCFAVIPPGNNFDAYHVVSGGWDQRLCIWNLETGDLVDVFRDPKSLLWEERELAADDVILDMSYSPERNEIAYSSADHVIYIRRFSPVGSEMKLLNTLKGHDSEVPCVLWNPDTKEWITASDDQTIKIWSGEGLNDCLMTLHTGGPIFAITWDVVSKALVACVDNEIRVYDIDEQTLVQTNRGHTDEVRSVIHIPDRNHYVSGSRDGQINIWNSWRRPRFMKQREVGTGRRSARGEENETEMTTASAIEEKIEGNGEAEEEKVVSEEEFDAELLDHEDEDDHPEQINEEENFERKK